MSSSSARRRSVVDCPQVDHQEARQRRVAATADSCAAIVFVSRYVRDRGQMEMENIVPSRSLPGDSKEEQRKFCREFKEKVVDLIREFRRHFPYRQQIQWTIEYGIDNAHEHTLDILVKPPRSVDNH